MVTCQVICEDEQISKRLYLQIFDNRIFHKLFTKQECQYYQIHFRYIIKKELDQ